MTIDARILASLVRVTDAATAEALCSRIGFDVRPLGVVVAHQMPGGVTPGIAINADWLEIAGDDEVDGMIAHEIAHVAYGPNGADVRSALGNFTRMKARHVPAIARDDYNRATDAQMEAAIAAMRPQPFVPATFASDVRMKLWWLQSRLASRITEAVLADPPIDRSSPTLEEDIRARLPDLEGNSEELVMRDLLAMFGEKDVE